MSRRVEGGTTSNSSSQAAHYVGPYKLGKTLGKGQTGLVKKATHVVTNKVFAIKIINREHLSESVQAKVEREIAIMKLLEHSHVLKLIDVYENRKNLYLVLEHVSGGELFDYLVRKGRLSPREALRFFRQIVSAVDFCHRHNVCHRDLKPENLLLDDRSNIKVADFGMASLQPAGNMLETSCGSPHYACPEVIRGDKYDGTAADVWSLGVILFALLVGALPFDDDNLRTLLEKVKRGVYHIPHFVPPEAQDLIRGMICTDPKRRMSLQDVLQHQWMSRGNENDGGAIHDAQRGQAIPLINAEDDLDPDVMASMSSLGCFKDREQLVSKLLSNEECTEKYVYHLLLNRKERHPSTEDDENRFGYDLTKQGADRPRKRTDSTSSLNKLGNISRKNSILSLQNGTQRTTPTTPQRSSSTHTDVGLGRGRSASQGGSRSARFSWSSVSTPKTSPNPSAISTPLTSTNSSRGPSPPSSPSWTKRLSNSIKNSFLGTPRFHRRKPASRDGSVPSLDDSILPNSPSTESTEKRSWFKDVWNSVGNNDGVYTLFINEEHQQRVKIRLVQAFLSVPNLNHNFRHPCLIEISYQEQNSIPFHTPKPYKAQVEISRVHNNRYQVTFQLISGNSKRFARTFQKIQHVIDSYETRQMQPQVHTSDHNMNMSSEIRMYNDELIKMCENLQSQHMSGGACVSRPV